MNQFVLAACVFAGVAATAWADRPHVSYVFPAGGQRGTTVAFKVGGHFLHGSGSFQMSGPGITASSEITEVETRWLEGPLVPKPGSQQKQDYPKDHLGQVEIAADAPLGARRWRVSTSQGVTPSRQFIVGDYPEIVEEEIAGRPIPRKVTLPVTINGRIFPREDVDAWTFTATKGQSIRCEVHAARLGSPLDGRLTLFHSSGQPLAESLDAFGNDPALRFSAPDDGEYQVRVADVNSNGLQDHVYRLTITSDPFVESIYPLGGRRGVKTKFQLFGQATPAEPVEIPLPAKGRSAEGRSVARRVPVGDKETNLFWIDLDDLPEHLEQEPNDDLAAAHAVEFPAVLNGRIQSSGDADAWSFSAAEGETWNMEIRAARLGSRLDSVLIVLDSEGKELARSDDFPGLDTDSSLTFKSPKTGKYFVKTQDRFASRGGKDFAYRL
ncbi:MAG: PPC domain-containing protein, partial [Planctomycetales bacterium]